MADSDGPIRCNGSGIYQYGQRQLVDKDISFPLKRGFRIEIHWISRDDCFETLNLGETTFDREGLRIVWSKYFSEVLGLFKYVMKTVMLFGAVSSVHGLFMIWKKESLPF